MTGESALQRSLGQETDLADKAEPSVKAVRKAADPGISLADSCLRRIAGGGFAGQIPQMAGLPER